MQNVLPGSRSVGIEGGRDQQLVLKSTWSVAATLGALFLALVNLMRFLSSFS